IFMSFSIVLTICAGHPESQQTKDPTSTLKARQCLPLAFKNGNCTRMKWIGRGKRFISIIFRKPIWKHFSVFYNPFGILTDGFLGLLGQASPFEESAPNDLGSFGFSGHYHRLADTVQHMLELLIVRFILVV